MIKVCPICQTVLDAVVYCPNCRRAHIIVRMLTLAQVNAKLMKNTAGRALLEKAAKALEGAKA